MIISLRTTNSVFCYEKWTDLDGYSDIVLMVFFIIQHTKSGFCLRKTSMDVNKKRISSKIIYKSSDRKLVEEQLERLVLSYAI